MKFEKPTHSAQSTQLTAEVVALADRYAARRDREESERRSKPPNQHAATKLAQSLRDLGSSIDVSGLRDGNRAPLARPRDLRDLKSSQQAALEHLGAIQDQYAGEPLTVSEELIRSHPAPEYVGEDL